MASLNKPLSCSKCNHSGFSKFKKPERWVCNNCYHIEVLRPIRNDPDKCRVCGISRDNDKNIKFKKGQNICRLCASDIHEEWRKDNKDHRSDYLKKHWGKKGKDARRESVRRSQERTIESFLGTQAIQIRNRCKYDKKREWATYDICDIDTEYLLELWNNTGGRCALTSLPMVYKTGSLYTVSVDRIDSKGSYTRDNVQLICKGINLLKNKHTQEETIEFLISLQSAAVITLRRLGKLP